MPSFDIFNDSIEDIYKKFIIKNKKLVKKYLDKRDYKMFYHMHPNRRLKKMFFVYPYKLLSNGMEANMPFFTISVNKVQKNNKKKFLCIYNNFYEGGLKEIKLNFSTKEDNISVKHNIKELKKVIKMIKYAFDELTKSFSNNVDFYQQ